MDMQVKSPDARNRRTASPNWQTNARDSGMTQGRRPHSEHTPADGPSASSPSAPPLGMAEPPPTSEEPQSAWVAPEVVEEVTEVTGEQPRDWPQFFPGVQSLLNLPSDVASGDALYDVSPAHPLASVLRFFRLPYFSGILMAGNCAGCAVPLSMRQLQNSPMKHTVFSALCCRRRDAAATFAGGGTQPLPLPAAGRSRYLQGLVNFSALFAQALPRAMSHHAEIGAAKLFIHGELRRQSP